MIGRLNTWCMGLALFGLVGAAGARRAAESDEARAIKVEVCRNVETIKSLDVSYQLETTTELTPEQLRSIPDYRNQMFLPKDEWRVAFSGAKRYQRHLQREEVKLLVELDEFGLFAPNAARPDDPPAIQESQKKLRANYEKTIAGLKANAARGIPVQKRKARDVLSLEADVTFGFNGRTLWRRKPNGPKGDSYLIWPTGTPAHWFQGTGYLAAVGLHRIDPTGSPESKKAQSMFQLPELLSKVAYELESKTEVVDGSTCVILSGDLSSLLEAGVGIAKVTDRIWLDRDHGLALRKREMTADGKLGWRFTTSDMKEVVPGFWLPMTTRNEQFPRGKADLGGKPATVETIKVKSLTINHVPDSLFDMTPRQGDQIEDLRGKL